MSKALLELVCPAGTPAALRDAIDAGADVVYVGFRDETNARNFPGLNFSRPELRDGIGYAHQHGREVFVAINTYAAAGNQAAWHRAIDDAAALGADAVIIADIGLLDYASQRHPSLRLHLSVQAAASHADAIRFYHEAFGVRRVVLPRVLTVAEIAKLTRQIPVETEVFAFGGMCPMAEGRCSLSSYVTGQSPNRQGVCSPASHVRYEQRGDKLVSSLGGSTINIFGKDEKAGYPTLCKGRFAVGDYASYLFEEPTSLSTGDILKDLAEAGVKALKIEGRQRGRAYVAEVVRQFRELVDGLSAGRAMPAATAALRQLAEGQQDTFGAYRKAWR
ncbi:peptidase U32 family protein [uncultured Ferrovibrio sp.]|jgi:collagenase-like PrtC family protease|uniref:ubiquinone anaerobic biosynthesis protein UbiU n=1 Tax=uncultured Ferrovibrio sp. TaxID=1576913 RepID=UPI002610F733|nr:peptidase U32 family protein [uncultured Ferrovibrio sp.]